LKPVCPFLAHRFSQGWQMIAGQETERKSIMTLKKSTTTTAEKANPPIAKIRVGLITASIWERPSESGTFYSVSFERRYRDSDGNWQTTHSYDTGDLLALAKAADLAHSKIVEAQTDGA